jgi:hypothetical protein
MKTLLVIPLALLLAGTAGAGPSQIGGCVSPDGKEEIICDLPGSEHLHNTGGMGPRGPGSGAGLCVFTSIEHCGRYQNEASLSGFQKSMTHETGGGYPDKVDAMLKRYAPHVLYVQYTGKDTSLLKLALKTSRMVGVTYGYSPRYGGPIAHMVNLVHLSDHWACILDNNFPGENSYEWMSPDEFIKRWTAGSPDRSGWAVILLNPPPPPPPHNQVAPKNDFSEPAAQVRAKRRPLLARRAQKEEPTMYETMLCLSLLLPGGWGAVPCGLVSPDDAEERDDDYQWEWRHSDPGRYYLYRGGVQVGGYDIWFDYFRPYDPKTQKWGPKGDPPILPPNKHKPPVSAARLAVENYGVDYSGFPEGEACSLNGRKCPKEHAKRAIEGKGDNLQDDSRKLRLTVFGAESERSQVLAGLSPALKDKLDIQVYPPDHWIVAQRGFKIGLHPTIYLEAPDGTVIHRQEGWDSPQSLAKAIERADPNYDPSKDPDLRKPKPAPDPGPNATPAPVDPSGPSNCPTWALHVLNSFLTTITLVTLYLLTHRSPPWTPPPSFKSYP